MADNNEQAEGSENIKKKDKFIDSLVVAVVVAMIIKGFLFQTYTIPSESMLHTLKVGDFIIVNRLSYKFFEPSKGDVVVFEYPIDPSKDFIKRIVAVEGDEVRLENKKLYINGELVQEDYKYITEESNIPARISSKDNFRRFTVPEDVVFVMGDNRDNSYDSRFWGFVPEDKIKGKAFVIYWSLRTPPPDSPWSDGILRTFRFINPKYTRFDRIMKLIH